MPTYIQQALTLRVKDGLALLENPMRESRSKEEKAVKQPRKHAEGNRTKPKGFVLFVALHRLWMGYMSELLGLAAPDSSSSPPEGKMPSPSSIDAKFVQTDRHGSLLRGTFQIACLVGLSGIVVDGAENFLKIATRKDQLKLVPKQNSIFTLAIPFYSTLPYIEFDLYSNQFCFRPADRSRRKFKSEETMEL
ncbi:hypothetical protein BDN67DRAFT_992879 [Paxillus ammoniavirescens]|nr:hypothetical protein BDN67DRAFT_992879 [Paxillus ammoniavirescens]